MSLPTGLLILSLNSLSLTDRLYCERTTGRQPDGFAPDVYKKSVEYMYAFVNCWRYLANPAGKMPEPGQLYIRSELQRQEIFDTFAEACNVNPQDIKGVEKLIDETMRRLEKLKNIPVKRLEQEDYDTTIKQFGSVANKAFARLHMFRTLGEK